MPVVVAVVAVVLRVRPVANACAEVCVVAVSTQSAEFRVVPSKLSNRIS
jgi:hypothetical protein